MSVKMRQRVERAIVRRLVVDALTAGYTVSVHNGGQGLEVRGATTWEEVRKAMFATDDERLYFREDDGRTHIGWVQFVYGNDGWDVISDYTVNLEHIMAGAQKLADKYSD